MANTFKLREIIKNLTILTGNRGKLPIEIEEEIKKIERLASIGEAVELAFNKGACLIYDMEFDNEDNIVSYNCDYTIEDVLEWGFKYGNM